MRIARMAMAGLLAACITAGTAYAGTGNGIPGNPEYNLELIAQNQCPSTTGTGSNTHVIFLQANFTDPNVTNQTLDTLNKINKIWLTQGPFAVLVGNACNPNLGGGAFQLPAGGYQVYTRSVGKLGTGLSVTTCGFITTTTGLISVCSSSNAVTSSTKNKKFQNVTQQLTTLTVLINGVPTVVPLFSPLLTNYFWSIDTTGKAHAQVFFVGPS